jgi:hypothetical protein
LLVSAQLKQKLKYVPLCTVPYNNSCSYPMVLDERFVNVMILLLFSIFHEPLLLKFHLSKNGLMEVVYIYIYMYYVFELPGPVIPVLASQTRWMRVQNIFMNWV